MSNGIFPLIRLWSALPALLCLLISAFPAGGAEQDAAGEVDAIELALELAGADRRDLVPDPFRLMASRTASRQLPLFRALMADPLNAAYRTGLIEAAFRNHLESPHRLMMTAGSLFGADIARGYIGNPMARIDEALLDAADPLVVALSLLKEASGEEGGEWNPVVPSAAELPHPLRHEVARLIAVIASSERFRRRAFAQLPPEATPERLRRQAILGQMTAFEEPDYRMLIEEIEKEALLAGMLDLVAVVEDFDAYMQESEQVPPATWSLETPLGDIIIDTTGGNNVHRSSRPLLVVDLDGDDEYHFRGDDLGGRISVLYDGGGDDVYHSDPGVGPDAAVLGYAILWDAGGEDGFSGESLCQGAALFGASLLYSGGGNDAYASRSHSQAHALAGVALLVSMGGDDRFDSLGYSQASGGAEGVAVLLNAAGNDRYTLGNDPLIRPSSQLPDRNISMGQGAGTGIRADLGDGRSTTGGIGMLLDLEGDDVYTAQVFAQGAGYLEGTGILVDGGGSDTFEAAWYAMAASAHRAAGILISRGGGDDSYTASHYTSIGAAHDDSIAFFLEEGGDDSYSLGNLGIGGANENGTAIFVDAAGDDTYHVESGECLAFGGAKVSHWGTRREDAVNVGLFFDLGGENTYHARRPGPGNDATWTWPRQHPGLALRSESGAGVDGEYANPFRTQAMTPRSDLDLRMRREAIEARRAFRQADRYTQGLSGGE